MSAPTRKPTYGDPDYEPTCFGEALAHVSLLGGFGTPADPKRLKAIHRRPNGCVATTP